MSAERSAYVEMAADHGECATCQCTGRVFSVVVPLDTEPEIYDRFYTTRFCHFHAYAEREAFARGGGLLAL